MPLYTLNGKLLVNDGKLSVHQDCCCFNCENCESFLVDDIDVPTITKYPLTAIVTLENVVYGGNPTGCPPPEDCGICGTFNRTYVCSISSMNSETTIWKLRAFTLQFPDHFTGARDLFCASCVCERDQGQQIFLSTNQCFSIPSFANPDCHPVQYRLGEMDVILQTRGFNDLVVQTALGDSQLAVWKTTRPVKRYTYPCADHVIDVMALPVSPITLSKISPGTYFGPTALNGLGQCIVPSSISVLFADFVELPLVNFGVPFP